VRPQPGRGDHTARFVGSVGQRRQSCAALSSRESEHIAAPGSDTRSRIAQSARLRLIGFPAVECFCRPERKAPAGLEICAPLELSVNGADQRGDRGAHRLIGSEHDYRDRGHDQGVLSHRLTAFRLGHLHKQLR